MGRVAPPRPANGVSAGAVFKQGVCRAGRLLLAQAGPRVTHDRLSKTRPGLGVSLDLLQNPSVRSPGG